MRAGLRRSLAAAATVAVLGLAACTAAPPTAPATPTPTLRGVSVEVYQTRFDYADRVLEIRVNNTSDAALNLESASFTSPHFRGAAVYDRKLTIRAGLTTDLRVKLPPVDCDARGSKPGTVRLDWKDGSRTSSATFEPTDGTGAIERIVREDCLDAAVLRTVSFTPSPTLRVEGVGADSVAWIDLTIAPTGGAGSVTIDGVRATLLVASATGLDWPVGMTVQASSTPRVVPLNLRPTRCDPHAIAEDKRGTVFPVVVTTSDGFAGTYDLALSRELRGQVYEWITAHCSG